MSFYDQQPWGAGPARQPSWDQQVPPSRSGATSASSNEPTAFLAQIEEVDRAIDNLMKSGKYYPGIGGPGPQALGMPGRRDSMPVLSRAYPDYDARPGSSSRHHSISEYDGGRSGSSAGLQGYYAGQRFPPRQTDQDQALQAKRRIAAQRERELRNYHQEQQYNKNAPGVKTDRAMSPNTLSEDERRDLIARQHRALYGNESALYPADGSGRPPQDARMSMSGNPRGPSPLAFDPFSVQQQKGGDASVQMPPREQMTHGGRSSTSPTSGNQSSFGIDSGTQSAGNTASSPTTSPSIGSGNMPSIATQSGVAPIGTRPPQSAATKRATTPNERSTSSASNPTASDKTPNLGWGSSSGVWGSKNTLGVQASSSPRPQSPVNSPGSPSTGSTTARATSPKAPGGPATAIRRKAAADRADKIANVRPSSTRAAGAGGSSSTMLRLYTDESPGLKVDPFVVLVLSVGFIISVVALHIIAKITRRFSS
ncbi:Protein transport protein Sec61 subunit beta [Sphaceloma murrayae]|uniref:Protein transport protein Sec61 subunit beta n=1 Tax=Sphaceloma murrayae TaxID=2082308 RepID=A0A2K1QWU3_9PEZI|nr:Protein transport protein Sec61 subunit beta [Sphaceloma murrayae]